MQYLLMFFVAFGVAIVTQLVLWLLKKQVDGVSFIIIWTGSVIALTLLNFMV
jgi:hypothetical protein